MKTHILTSGAAALIPVCNIGRPEPAFGPTEGGAETPATPPPVTPVTAFPDVGPVLGDVPADWGDLDKKYGTGGEQPLPPPPDATRGTDTTKEAAPDAAKTDATQAAPPNTKKPEENATAANAGPKTTPTPEGGKPTQPTTKPEAETKPAATPPDATKPFDADAALKQLEEIQPKPGASQKTLDGFKAIKEITKQAIGLNKTYVAKMAELENQLKATPKLDPTVEQELNELREFRATWETENDPKFTEQYTKQLTAAEETVLKTLVEHPGLKMPQAQADRLKELGFDSEEGQEMIDTIMAAVQKTGSYRLTKQVEGLFAARQKVLDEKAARLAELRGKQGNFVAAQREAQEAERKEWGGNADKKLVELFKDATWGHYKEIKDDMEPAAKLAAEAHNANLKEKLVPAIREAIQSVYNRDPEKAMEHVFRSFALDATKAELANAQGEIAKLQSRVAELEEVAKGVRRISNPTSEEQNGAPITPPGSVVDFSQSAEAAIDGFLATKTQRQA